MTTIREKYHLDKTENQQRRYEWSVNGIDITIPNSNNGSRVVNRIASQKKPSFFFFVFSPTAFASATKSTTKSATEGTTTTSSSTMSAPSPPQSQFSFIQNKSVAICSTRGGWPGSSSGHFLFELTIRPNKSRLQEHKKYCHYSRATK